MSRTSPSSNAKQRPVRSMLIGERHTDISSKKVLLEMLPFLKENDYTFLLEHNDNASIDDAINHHKLSMESGKKGLVDFENYYISKLGKEDFNESLETARILCTQSVDLRHTINKLEPEIQSKQNTESKENLLEGLKDIFSKHKDVGIENFLNNAQKFFPMERTVHSSESYINLLNSIKELDIKYKNIDLSFSREATNYINERTEDFQEKRNTKMAKNINDIDGPFCGLIGMSHLLEVHSQIIDVKRANVNLSVIISNALEKYTNEELTPYNISLFHLSNETDINTTANSLKEMAQEKTTKLNSEEKEQHHLL